MKAPSVFGQNIHVYLKLVLALWGFGEVTYRNSSADQLAFATQPLSLWNEWDAIAFLMYG